MVLSVIAADYANEPYAAISARGMHHAEKEVQDEQRPDRYVEHFENRRQPCASS